MDTQVAVRENISKLKSSVEWADEILKRSYLPKLCTNPVVRDYVNKKYLAQSLNGTVRFFEINRVVINRNECMRDKLASVFNAVNNTGASLLFQIKGERDKVTICIGVRTQEDILTAQKVLSSSLEGNFPGTKFSGTENVPKPLTIEQVQQQVLDNFKDGDTVAVVSDIAGIRSQEESQERQFVQGLEKVIDAMRGKEYTLFLIADAISLSDLNAHRRSLENLYTQLVPLSSCQLSLGENVSQSWSHSMTEGISSAINTSVSDSVTHTVGKNSSETWGTSSSTTTGTFESTSNTVSGGVGIPFLSVANVGFSRGKSYGTSSGYSEGKSFSETSGTSTSDSVGRAESRGTSIGQSSSETLGNQNQLGQSFTMQIQEQTHFIVKMMERIDKMLERYDQCADLGMWNSATYCIGDQQTVQMLSSIYRSAIRGKDSSLENGAIIVWNKEESKRILDYLRIMEHPRFKVHGNEVTPGTLVSSRELAIQAGLPNRSVPGIPVLECAEFGRNVSSYDPQNSSNKARSDMMNLGSIFHMHKKEALGVSLNLQSLTSHTFITGSTGSGKSNTIYRMLAELMRLERKFLVVEPAKGEYKKVLGGLPSVSVYGTNPSLTSLLRINPFSFPHGNNDVSKNIHILEHLDRLVEIFNVCWPMYAAMPAVLKEAIEKSYEDCGWNLVESTNPYEGEGQLLYPTFADVARNVRLIIDSSEYDAENKGAYKGALLTRLKSLTNGINGLVFTTDELAASDLFNKNVIADLSRVGSMETKSLIMGLLVLKLQEHRMTEGRVNSNLHHVTVLEEAHNLLKRTSAEQGQDSGNLLGKSVEMLANAIAEMRTYGEGFIIADQAPALLDMAVIRNTNTKIIMRLPDQTDRELVGRAANLSQDQITELARLPLGVAAVYQNEWIEPVLCQVELHDDAHEYHLPKDDKQCISSNPQLETRRKLDLARLLCDGTKLDTLTEAKEKIQGLNLSACIQVQALRLLLEPAASPRYTRLAPVVAELFPKAKESLKRIFERTSEILEWTDTVDREIKLQVAGQEIEEELHRSIRQCIVTQLLYNELGKIDQLERWAREGGAR